MNFLNKWRKAVVAYGTPANFADNVSFADKTLHLFRESQPFIVFINPNHAMKRQLMKEQTKHKPQRADYGLRQDLDGCFMCENVSQAVDIGDNIIDAFGSYYVLPNRYPPFPGAWVLLSQEHDDLASRTSGLITEEGKTRGSLIPPDLLGTLMGYCDSNSMVALRNHPLDGMSVPYHDHFHGFPLETPVTRLTNWVLWDMLPTEYGKHIFKAQNTAFDTLIINGPLEEVVDMACPLLRRMELANEVFTLIYIKGNLLVGSRNSRIIGNKGLERGIAGTPIHFLDHYDGSTEEMLMKYVPHRGTFTWDNYVD